MAKICVSIVYALPDHQEVINIRCLDGTPIRDAIEQSKLCDKYPEIDLQKQQVGVYGLKQSLEFALSDNDRVEIYRPLLVSPTEARRLRAISRQQKKVK